MAAPKSKTSSHKEIQMTETESRHYGLGSALSVVSDSPKPRIMDAYSESLSAGLRLDLMTSLRVLMQPPYWAPPCMVLVMYDSWAPPLRRIQELSLLSRSICRYPGLRLAYLLVLVLSDLGQDQMHGSAVRIWLSIDAAMMSSISHFNMVARCGAPLGLLVSAQSELHF